MNPDDLERLASALGGVSILGCLRGSPAEQAGLQYGDVLLEVNGVPTPSWVAYIDAIRERGAKMSVKFSRGGNEQTVTLEMPQQRPVFDPMRFVRSVVDAGVLPATVQLPDDEPDRRS
ncbi:MAG: PDZ domain-containing protein [Archangium sp.]|nr:PDZ domain-containing protein [Archangium sp.]